MNQTRECLHKDPPAPGECTPPEAHMNRLTLQKANLFDLTHSRMETFL